MPVESLSKQMQWLEGLQVDFTTSEALRLKDVKGLMFHKQEELK